MQMRIGEWRENTESPNLSSACKYSRISLLKLEILCGLTTSNQKVRVGSLLVLIHNRVIGGTALFHWNQSLSNFGGYQILAQETLWKSWTRNENILSEGSLSTHITTIISGEVARILLDQCLNAFLELNPFSISLQHKRENTIGERIGE
jgi:hypothetical protein